jgi:hypothetical protein
VVLRGTRTCCFPTSVHRWSVRLHARLCFSIDSHEYCLSFLDSCAPLLTGFIHRHFGCRRSLACADLSGDWSFVAQPLHYILSTSEALFIWIILKKDSGFVHCSCPLSRTRWLNNSRSRLQWSSVRFSFTSFLFSSNNNPNSSYLTALSKVAHSSFPLYPPAIPHPPLSLALDSDPHRAAHPDDRDRAIFQQARYDFYRQGRPGRVEPDVEVFS